MTETITRNDIRHQVAETITGTDIDVETATDEVLATFGLVDIEDIDSADYWAAIARAAGDE